MNIIAIANLTAQYNSHRKLFKGYPFEEKIKQKILNKQKMVFEKYRFADFLLVQPERLIFPKRLEKWLDSFISESKEETPITF